MVALITDVQYRMSPALIRRLAQEQVTVYTCEKACHKVVPGARSKYVKQHFTLPSRGYENALYDLVKELGQKEGCKPALLPVGAATLQTLAENIDRFKEVAGLCLGTPAQLELFNSKTELHRLAHTLGVPVPQELTPEDAVYPCVVKPVCGEKLGLHAAERYTIAHTPAQVQEACQRFSAQGEPVVQEYLPGGGCGCSVIAQNGKILAYIGHRRIREYPVSGGPSSCCVAEDRQDLLEWAQKLVEATGFSGPAMFEFKEGADGAPRLLECNPRIWGSFPLTDAAASSLPFCWFAAAWNNGNPQQKVPLPQNHFKVGKRLIFFPSDLAAGLGYLKKKKFKKTLQAFGDLCNPAVKDGVFTWNDPKPALTYYIGRVKNDED